MARRTDITQYLVHLDQEKHQRGGASTNHSGIDIPAPEGTKLVCIMDGEVVSCGWGGAGGYTITIKSTDGKYKF